MIASLRRHLRWDSLNPGRRAALVSGLCTLAVVLYVCMLGPSKGFEYSFLGEACAVLIVLLIPIAFAFGVRALFLVRRYGWRGILISATLSTAITGFMLGVMLLDLFS